MRAPQIRFLADGRRLHLQDGPIDLIVEARGSEASVGAAYDAAARRFTGLLDELCEELPLLRQPADLKLSVERIQENCEPALCTVLFMGGAGGSLRAGVTDNPVRLTRSVKEALTRVTSGGAPVYVWPGGGITFMVDVTRLPAGAFGYVPTPALVAPIEFTLRLSDYAALGGHMDHVRPLASLTDNTETRQTPSLQSAPGRRA